MKVYFSGGPGLPGKGEVPAKYMLVGIAPSTRRPPERHLEPFGSTAYKVVEAMSHAYPVYFTNLVKEPIAPGTPPTQLQIAQWKPVLDLEIRLVKPQRILALGSAAAHVLCPGFKDLNEDHGTFFRNKEFGCFVVPTYHFAAISRDPAKRDLLGRDLERFFDLPDPASPEYQILSAIQQLPEFPEGTEVALDLETTGVELTDKITMLGLQPRDGIAYILVNPGPAALEYFFLRASKRNYRLIGHNLAFDLAMIQASIKRPVRGLKVRDTMILAHIAGEETLSLKHLTTRLTDLPGSRGAGGFTDPLYLAEDLRSTLAVYDCLPRAQQAFAAQVVQDLIPTIVDMRVRGVYINRDILEDVGRHAEQEVKRLEDQLFAVSKVRLNLNSPAQVSKFLLELGIPLTEKTPSGNFSVSEKVLLALEEKLSLGALDSMAQVESLKALLEFRGASKLVSGFIKPYREFLEMDGRLHPRLLLHGTSTGRLSCRNPNLQQVPRVGRLKEAFVSEDPKGLIGLVDLAQAELRVAVLLSGDKALMSALLSEDVHLRIASMILRKDPSLVTSTERKASKKITFGILYGGTPKGLAERAGLSEKRVIEVLRVFRTEFPQLSRWLADQAVFVEKHGQGGEAVRITSPFGRIRKLSPGGIEGHGFGTATRQAVNTPIQSLASDIMLLVLRATTREIREKGLSSRPLFGVHDSLVFDVHDGEAEAFLKILENAFHSIGDSPLANLPLFPKLPILGDAALGPSWASVEETNGAYGPIATRRYSSL